ncbi:MAG TPA: methyltransferase domain-containing protein [Chromatiaceae bacterium]|jgi:sarcosine/dimethylglycine N-methyltransferase|nr:methyltransferase domain-containing protein [Chromatiaceae bacterium]HIB83098.1 methyltransferase domain-containing protein [Chromatiaceae bacterium]HIN83206.1 methyltransferase domain-containing protein [Chromatiales bacterium]HIO14736.1 methyltransferase domain-containing protein [Chromatiales bacterium]HIO53627.1 methyltransferase domain-containing protein [Chromatiales bacterium]
MSAAYSEVVETARQYYNSKDADNFYFHVWGGEDIHIGLYEDDEEPIADASARTVRHMAESVSHLNTGSQVLDLGAGYGGSARHLARVYSCHVTALNLSETENKRNRVMNAEQGFSETIKVADGSFEDIPAEDQSFDLAWSQDAILHSGHRKRVMDEVDRILKPGGEFIFTDPMQADDCPAGVLKPVLDRIHLDSLGSFAFYRAQAQRLGWQEIGVADLTHQLVKHYTRVRQELTKRREGLVGIVSDEYMARMIQGLGHWIDAGDNGYLAWGVLHFRKPE